MPVQDSSAFQRKGRYAYDLSRLGVREKADLTIRFLRQKRKREALSRQILNNLFSCGPLVSAKTIAGSEVE